MTFKNKIGPIKEEAEHSYPDNLDLKIAVIGVILAVVLAIVACVYENSVYNGVEKTAIYKGYYIQRNRQYPIIEIDGKEYMSKVDQKVRDAAYSDKTVLVRIDMNKPGRFVILWDKDITSMTQS